VGSAMRAAQSLATVGLIRRSAGSYAKLPKKLNLGLSAALEKVLSQN
jgi:hypothetical protein